jgi:type II secretory pathway pseudopilin PulG
MRYSAPIHLICFHLQGNRWIHFKQMKTKADWRGYTLSETIIGITIILILVATLFGAVLLSARHIINTRAKSQYYAELLLLRESIQLVNREIVTGYWEKPNSWFQIEGATLRLRDSGTLKVDADALIITFDDTELRLDTMKDATVTPLRDPDLKLTYGFAIRITHESNSRELLIIPTLWEVAKFEPQR